MKRCQQLKIPNNLAFDLQVSRGENISRDNKKIFNDQKQFTYIYWFCILLKLSEYVCSFWWKTVVWNKQLTVLVWEVDIVVPVNRLLNFAEFWFTKCRKFVKVPFGQRHLVFVLHKSFLWFKNQECWWTLRVFIKSLKLSNETNVNFTYFLRSIFQIIWFV